jgi:hypothetical protein
LQHRLRLHLVRVGDCVADRAQDLQVGRVKSARIMLSHDKLDIFGNELAANSEKGFRVRPRRMQHAAFAVLRPNLGEVLGECCRKLMARPVADRPTVQIATNTGREWFSANRVFAH